MRFWKHDSGVRCKRKPISMQQKIETVRKFESWVLLQKPSELTVIDLWDSSQLSTKELLLMPAIRKLQFQTTFISDRIS